MSDLSSPVVIHSIPGSPYGRVVMLALEEKAVPYRLAVMGFGEARKAAYLALQPFGRIPVMKHGDFTLYETQAIMRYIDRTFDGPALQPTDLRALARMDQLMNIIDWYLFPQVTVTIPFQRLVAPRLGRETDEAIIAAAVPNARHCIGVIEAFLGDKPFVAGDSISLADLMLTTHIEYLSLTPEGAEVLKGSRLADWLARMQARPSLKATTVEAQRAAA
ncbi:MAG TPA: glutathione S-transferase family protein [Caulobacteraceae bacterium]|jgi:glutathione S-transferase